MSKQLGRPRKYHFGDLQIGESFVVPLRSGGHRTSIASAANYHERRYGGKFETRVVRIEDNRLIHCSHSKAGQTGTHCQVTRTA